jgi:FdhD protein
MARSPVLCKPVIKINDAGMQKADDMLAAEEPLEIRMSYGAFPKRVQKSISVTMRTPGNDFELAKGFLFTEGIIKNASDIVSIKHCNGLHENVVRVEMRDDLEFDLSKLERNFYTTSSCGVCGKSSIEAVRTVCQLPHAVDQSFQISPGIIYSLPGVLRAEQAIFKKTGGLHACALFDVSGNLVLTREDVGRHNALDKLIGAAMEQTSFPLGKFVLLLSGRASFELIQKAWMSGIKVVAAVGAPSSLAVEMAEEFGMTLIGFLRGEVFNIYSGSHRIKMDALEGSYKS